VAALIEEHEDNAQCEILIKRVLQPLIIPLQEKINKIHLLFLKEGQKLTKADINEHLYDSVHGFL
jgi:hypothetical protein